MNNFWLLRRKERLFISLIEDAMMIYNMVRNEPNEYFKEDIVYLRSKGEIVNEELLVR